MQQQVDKQKLSITQVERLLQGNSPFVFSDRDLSRLDLQGREMNGAKFVRSVLIQTNFSNSQIAEADFRSSKLSDALFINSDLTGSDLNNSKVSRTNFSNAIMVRAILRYCTSIYRSEYADGPIFANTDLTNSVFCFAKILKANFSGSNLTGANLTSANLTGANLTGANLTNAILNGAILTNAILTNANLAGANLSSAFLINSNCENANFTNANLYQCRLSPATIVGAKFDGVITASFSSDLSGIFWASERFLSFLNRPDLSIDQKKQMLEIDDANPNKTKLSEYLKERGKIIINDRRAGSNEKSEFQYFLEEVIRLEEELIPKVVQQPLIKQEPGEPLIVVKSEPQEPHRVVIKRQREEDPPASANVGMGSRQDIPQGARIDNEALDAARILSSMRHNGRD